MGEKQELKKRIIVLASLISAALISSCGGSENQENSLSNKNEIETNEMGEITADTKMQF